MEAATAPWYAGLVGVVVGALATAAPQIIQNIFQSRREEKRLIVETAYKDYELRVKEKGTFNAFPFPVVLAYHEKTIELIQKGQLNEEAADKIFTAMNEMNHALERARKKFEGT
jgi:hypothetical protein